MRRQHDVVAVGADIAVLTASHPVRSSPSDIVILSLAGVRIG